MCLFFTVYGVMKPAVPAHVVCCTPNTSDFELPEICLFPLIYNKVNVMKSLCQMLRYYMKSWYWNKKVLLRDHKRRTARGVVALVLWWLGEGGCCPVGRRGVPLVLTGVPPPPPDRTRGYPPPAPLSPSSSSPAKTRIGAGGIPLPTDKQTESITFPSYYVHVQ